MVAALRIKSGSSNIEMAFLSVLDEQSWLCHMRTIAGQLSLEPTSTDDTLLALFSPPSGLPQETDIVMRKLNLKQCVCGRQAMAACARCFMQPYCSPNCQVRPRPLRGRTLNHRAR